MLKGINVYDEVRGSFGKINESREMEKRAASDKPCIFLCHKSDDKDAVREIGDYICNQGINIYLDEDDLELQTADDAGDDEKVTHYIERGIQCSSDIIMLISDETYKSWWVPFEFGYGKHAEKKLACLKLKNVRRIPSYLAVVPQLLDRKDLKDYLEKIRTRPNFQSLIKAARGVMDPSSRAIQLLTEALDEHERINTSDNLGLYLD